MKNKLYVNKLTKKEKNEIASKFPKIKNVKDEKPKYRAEYYRDDYNSLHQVILIDLDEEIQSCGKSTIFQRSKINPNLKHHYRNLILNKKHEVINDYFFEDED